MAISERPRVVIFDNLATPFRERADTVAWGAGWQPEEFEEVYAAQRRIGLGGISAVISTLGSGKAGVRKDFDYPAEPLIKQAGRLRIPVALISDAPNARHMMGKAFDSGIVVPEQPIERFNPLLRNWLTGLALE
jgi:hypothetical protein